MKGLDTPVLLAILHDTPTARELLKGLRGEELATTELNMFELQAIAAEGARSSRSARQTALLRLRRRISVLPIANDSVDAAGRGLSSNRGLLDYQALMWGTLAAAGCGEWITSRGYAPPKGAFHFKIRLV